MIELDKRFEYKGIENESIKNKIKELGDTEKEFTKRLQIKKELEERVYRLTEDRNFMQNYIE